MPNILLIQSRQRPEMVMGERDGYIRALAKVAEVGFISALDDSIDWRNPQAILSSYDGVILGGSGEFDLHGGREESDPARAMSQTILERLRPIVSLTFEKGVPIFGICYGHQLIAEMFGGNVTNDHSQKKTGTYEVTLTEDGTRDPIFSQLPHTFLAQYGHKDSVTDLPHGATLLATGADCKFSALRYGAKAYTTQFHPEMTADEARIKISRSPGYLPEGVLVDSIIKDSPDSSRVLPVWIKTIVSV